MITYTVSDGTTTDTGTLTLSVTAVPDAPTIGGLNKVTVKQLAWREFLSIRRFRLIGKRAKDGQ